MSSPRPPDSISLVEIARGRDDGDENTWTRHKWKITTRRNGKGKPERKDVVDYGAVYSGLSGSIPAKGDIPKRATVYRVYSCPLRGKACRPTSSWLIHGDSPLLSKLHLPHPSTC